MLLLINTSIQYFSNYGWLPEASSVEITFCHLSYTRGYFKKRKMYFVHYFLFKNR